MASTSDRRSDSSGGSKRPSSRSGASQDSARPSVYVSSRNRDRSLGELGGTSERAADGGGRSSPSERRSRRADAAPPKPVSRAAQAAQQLREARDARLAGQRRSGRLRTALAVAAVIASIAGCSALYNSPVFAVRRVEVIGTVRLSQARVRQLASVPTNATLIRFPADAVAERVAKEPWVASVTVSRLFPDGMRIRITEREPVAMVDAGSTFWLVDRTGMVIAKRSADQTGSILVVRDVPGLDPRPGRRTTSEALMNAIAVLEGISERLRAQIGSVSAPTIDGTTLYTRDKVEIVFGDAAEARTKDVLVQRILDEHRGRVVSIDVRTIDRPTWRGLTK
jgi:cell division protein FtsQ